MPDPALVELDGHTRLLVRAAAAVAGLGDDAVREALRQARDGGVPRPWMEELLLQSHLFSGFPRALNAMHEWRALVPGAPDDPREDPDGWGARGEATCRTVYGGAYERLRANVAALHPALERWMLHDGYGKVLGRPGLDLGRRELCIVAACAISQQDRQLHSHLRGARNAGVPHAVVRRAVESIADMLGPPRAAAVCLLLDRVAG